jgi:hypothetical protein
LDYPLGCHRLGIVHPGNLPPLLAWLRPVSPREPGARAPR